MSDALRAKIAAVPFWYHRIELPGGVVTPGWAPLNPPSYGVPPRLDGHRVLDVGAWDGYWTFEALKRGAKEVVAIDDFSDSLDATTNVPRGSWTTFDICKEALGYSDAQCSRRELSVYDITPEMLGMFDTVFFFGTLYHLRHPLLALDKLSAVCKQWMFVESAILDNYSPYRGGLGKGYPDGNQLLMEFYPDNQLGDNVTNWWSPTLKCLIHMVRVAGFKDVLGWKLTDQPTTIPMCRGFAAGRKPDAPPIPQS
jgi:tRNA (mo5U34)-methyltransferase